MTIATLGRDGLDGGGDEDADFAAPPRRPDMAAGPVAMGGAAAEELS